MITITYHVDPKLLAVNKRALTNAFTPPEVKRAMKELTDQTQLHLLADPPDPPLSRKRYYKATFVFGMVDLRTDCDGPLKRSMDAIFAGLGIPDSRVNVVYLERYRTDHGPRIFFQLEELPR